MRLSIVTTLYRSAPYLEEFCQRAQQAAQKITPDYEIILVNDGSPDDSLAQAIKLHERNPRISVIDLSRNFGHHRALMAGLTQAQGEKVFLIDSDLEEEPEWLETFNTAMTEGIDVVYGVQNHRKGAWFERVSGAIFYRLFNWLADVPIPTNAVTARLMTRQYVKSLLLHHEREFFLFGLLPFVGFRQVPVPVAKHLKSQSAYTLWRKLSLTVNAVTSFSNTPLVAIFYVGGFFTTVAGVGVALLLYRKLVLGVSVAGWSSLIVSIWFFGGLMIFCMGVIGIYLSKIFLEVKQRPRVIIRAVYSNSPSFQDTAERSFKP